MKAQSLTQVGDTIDAAVVRSGMTVALGGMTLCRRPVAFVRELLRLNPRPEDLTLVAFTAGYAADLLVGVGMVSRVRTCYFGLESIWACADVYGAGKSG